MPMFGQADEDELRPPDPLLQAGLGLIAFGVVICGLLLAAIVFMAPGVFAEWGMNLSGEYDIPCPQGLTVEAADEYVRNYDPPLKPFRHGDIHRRNGANGPDAIVVQQEPACGAKAGKPIAVNVVLGVR
jgi:hypothetical protein